MTNFEFLEENIPQDLHDCLLATRTYKAFAALEDACFGSVVEPYYKDRINDFATVYERLHLPITPKVGASAIPN